MSKLTPELIRSTALAAGYTRAEAEAAARFPGDVSARLEATKATHRQKSAELDALKSEVATLKLRKAEAAAAATPAPAAGTITAAAYLAVVAKPKMSRSEFAKIPHGMRGELIKTITLIP